jgi:Chalcone isomerase-like
MKNFATLLCAGLMLAAPWAAAQPLELGGFQVAQSLRIEPGDTPLVLQGGYVRRYFFRNTTSYALYTAEPLRSFEALISAASHKRMVVTVLMQQFTAEQFRSGWREQFEQALSASERQALAKEIEMFLDSFETLARGEQLSFDAIAGVGLRISLRGQAKRVIASDAFARALFSVWLGPRSVDAGLRSALLGSQ